VSNKKMAKKPVFLTFSAKIIYTIPPATPHSHPIFPMQDNPGSLTRQFLVIFGERVKSRRRDLKFTQAELSAEVNISRTALTNIEKGNQRTNVFLLARLAHVLKIPPGDLIPDLSEAKQRLQQAKQVSVSTPSDAELLTGEVQKLNISVESTGGLDRALHEVQSQHAKSPSSKRRTSP